jgi:nucleotide-binding universal stress UspA family protein
VERIVVGVDGSQESESALRWAMRVAAATHGNVVGVSAIDRVDADTPAERVAQVRAQWAEQLCRRLEQAPGVAAGWRIRVEQGHPVEVLMRCAEDERADLLVVGMRGAGGFAGLHLGSVAQRLTHHATRPLALVPLHGADGPLDPVVIGVDASAGTEAAVAWTADLAVTTRADVVAVHAVEPFAEWVPASDRRSWRRGSEHAVEVWTKPLREVGEVDVEVHRDIHPVAAIERAARDHDAGLVVVGARGLGGFTGLRLGRVPIQLVHHLGRPVVVVPPAS